MGRRCHWSWRSNLLASAVWIVVAWSGTVYAQNLSGGTVTIGRSNTPPKIDGVLAPNEWDSATKLELNCQYVPREHDTATEKTEVFLMFDKANLYIAFHAFDSDPHGIRAPYSKRDQISDDDEVQIWLDTYNDRRRAYVFRFNPRGIQADGIFTPSDTSSLTWDGILESKGHVTPDGYMVEAKIPFKTLRYKINPQKTWGLHLFRWIPRKAEITTWVKTTLANPDLFTQMGTIVGISDIDSSGTLDVIPTATLSNNGERELHNGVSRLHTFNRVSPGVTANYAITPNLTLSATVKPDFSQIENDVPQVSVNQRFPLFYPENRPFFLEGGEVFRSVFDRAPQIVDTRQIVAPDWGIKLTGKIGSNSIGFLSASDRSAGLRVPPTDDNYGKNAQFNIFRISHDILKNSTLGFLLTDRRFAGSKNTVETLDGRIQNGSDLIAFQASYSETKELDGRKQNGGAIYIVDTFDNSKLDFGISYSNVNKNFDAQSGFIRRTGYNRYAGYIGRTYRPGKKTWWERARPFFNSIGLWNIENKLDESYFEPGLEFDLPKNISLYASYIIHRDNFLGVGYTTHTYTTIVSVNRLKRISFFDSFGIGTGVNFDPARPEIGMLFNNELDIILRPMDKVISSFLWLKSNLRSRLVAERLFNQDIFRNRTVYQFDRFNSVRSIIDYDTSERKIGLSFLYGYTPRPNTALYFGYGDLLFNGLDPINNTRVNGLIRQSRSLFVKLSYNFRF